MLKVLKNGNIVKDGKVIVENKKGEKEIVGVMFVKNNTTRGDIKNFYHKVDTLIDDCAYIFTFEIVDGDLRVNNYVYDNNGKLLIDVDKIMNKIEMMPKHNMTSNNYDVLNITEKNGKLVLEIEQEENNRKLNFDCTFAPTGKLEKVHYNKKEQEITM